MALEPPRRTFSEPKKIPGSPREVDSAEQARKLHAWAWSIYGGIPLGLSVGLLMNNLLLGLFLGPLFIYGVVAGIAAISGRGAAVLYMPSGAGTPRKKEFSRAKALEIRGDFEGAIAAYETEILDAPHRGEPYLKIARMFRDELKDTEAAVMWFRRAQKEAKLFPGEEIRTHRELAEIFLHIRGEPRKAAPELARLAEAFPDTPDGEWAARELGLIKEAMADEVRAQGARPQEPPEDRPKS